MVAVEPVSVLLASGYPFVQCQRPLPYTVYEAETGQGRALRRRPSVARGQRQQRCEQVQCELELWGVFT